jgi:hypothetical protein
MTRLSLWVGVVVALAASLATGAQTKEAVGVIQGVVRNEGGDAVSQAYVAIHRGGQRGSRSVLTDEDGRFVVRDIVEGQYFVTASKSGYVTVQYGQSSAGRSAIPIAIASSNPRSIEIRMPRMGGIEGSVLDAEGRPAAPGVLALLAVPPMASPPPPGLWRGVTVRDGIFSADLLPPGAYVIRWNQDEPSISLVATDATRIVVAPGETLRGLIIHLPPAATAGRIEGALAPAPDGLASNTSIVRLYAESGLGGEAIEGRSVSTVSSAFDFVNLPPGRYTIVANNAPVMGRAGGAVIPGSWATQTIEVEPGATVRAEVQLERALAINGRLNLNSGSRPTDREWTVGIALVPVDLPSPLARNLAGSLIDQISQSGRFVVHNIPAGRYAIRIDSVDGNWHATSVLLQGREVVDQPIDISTDLSSIEVTLFDRLSELRGTVQDAQVPATAARAVALFADDPRCWWTGSPRVRLEPIALGGTFEIPDLPSGRYFIVAGDFDAGEPWTEAQLTGLRASAAEITLGRGERLIVDLQVSAGRTAASVKAPASR